MLQDTGDHGVALSVLSGLIEADLDIHGAVVGSFDGADAQRADQLAGRLAFPLRASADRTGKLRLEYRLDDIRSRLEGFLQHRVGSGFQSGKLLHDVVRITSYNVCYTKLLRDQAGDELRERGDQHGDRVQDTLGQAGYQLERRVDHAPGQAAAAVLV